MAISSFDGGVRVARLVGDDNGQDIKIGANEQTKAINVSGSFFFQDDFIGVNPVQSYQAYLNSVVCLHKSILKQLRIMNQHLASMSDLEDMEIEPGTDEGAF